MYTNSVEQREISAAGNHANCPVQCIYICGSLANQTVFSACACVITVMKLVRMRKKSQQAARDIRTIIA